MIEFRCWYCTKQHTAPDALVGKRILCNCKRFVRIPKRSGGSSYTLTIVDRLAVGAVCALLGFGLGLLDGGAWWWWVGITTLGGFLVGFLFGQRAVAWTLSIFWRHGPGPDVSDGDAMDAGG